MSYESRLASERIRKIQVTERLNKILESKGMLFKHQNAEFWFQMNLHGHIRWQIRELCNRDWGIAFGKLLSHGSIWYDGIEPLTYTLYPELKFTPKELDDVMKVEMEIIAMKLLAELGT